MGANISPFLGGLILPKNAVLIQEHHNFCLLSMFFFHDFRVVFFKIEV